MAKFALIAVFTVVEALRRLWQRVTGRVPVKVRLPVGTPRRVWTGQGIAGGDVFSRLWLDRSGRSAMGAWRRY